jgi:putative copper export protein
MTFFLISFTICFSIGLLLSVVLIYRDVKPHRPNGMNESFGQPYFWERVLGTLFGACQAGVAIAGIIAIVLALRSGGEMYWVDMAVRCNLQLLTGTNVRPPKENLRAF